MEFTDRILRCGDCGQDFVFTAGEQLFFFDKQFTNDPKRCKPCKAKRAGMYPAPEGKSVPIARTETRTNCSVCGVETTVPFKPTQGRPVLCRSCFQQGKTPIENPVALAEVVAASDLGKLDLEPISVPDLSDIYEA